MTRCLLVKALHTFVNTIEERKCYKCRWVGLWENENIEKPRDYHRAG